MDGMIDQENKGQQRKVPNIPVSMNKLHDQSLLCLQALYSLN